VGRGPIHCAEIGSTLRDDGGSPVDRKLERVVPFYLLKDYYFVVQLASGGLSDDEFLH
jgi:hypothetical protein